MGEAVEVWDGGMIDTRIGMPRGSRMARRHRNWNGKIWMWESHVLAVMSNDIVSA
jgi:hypothetical protein